MNDQIIDTIKEALNDVNGLTPEKLQNLVQETVATFQVIQGKVASDNEWEREEGLQIARNLKAAMEEQVQKLQEKLGMTPEQIEEYMANPANFSKEELKSIEESKKDMAVFKAKGESTTTTTPKRKSKQKLFIVS